MIALPVLMVCMLLPFGGGGVKVSVTQRGVWFDGSRGAFVFLQWREYESGKCRPRIRFGRFASFKTEGVI